MAKLSLTSLLGGLFSRSALNTNFNKIQTELNNKVLYRDNPAGEPNTMSNELDMSSNRIVNLPSPESNSDAARWVDVKNGVTGITEPIPSKTGNNKKSLTTDGASLVFGQIDSGFVDYDQGDASAAERTLLSRLQDVVSVKDFDARGDDLTDDTTAFTNAIAALNTAGGGTLFVPAGTYRANVTLNVGRVSIVGAGKGTIIAPTSGTCLTITGVTGGLGGLVKDISVSGVNGATTGIDIDGFSRGTVQDVYIENGLATGIIIDGDDSTETFFNNIYIHGVTTNPLKYTKTDGVDTGGLYFDNLHITGSASSSPHIEFISTHTSKSRAFAFFTRLITDNAPNGCMKFKNVEQIKIDNSWLTGTAAAKGLLELDDVKDVFIDNTSIQNSSASGYNILFTAGSIEDCSMNQMRLSGPGEDVHVVSATFTRCRLDANSTTTTKTNSSSSYRKLVFDNACRVYQNVVQTIATGTWTKINMDSETYDDGNNFDLTTDEYTVPQQGFYNIQGQVTFGTSVDGARLGASINIDGSATPIQLNYVQSADTDIETVPVSCTVYLDKGQTIELQGRQDSGSNKDTTNGVQHTALTVTKMRT